MSSFVNPLKRRSSGTIFAHASAIKGWVRQALGLDEEVVISVNEITCARPGCPPRETVVLVLREGSTVRLNIHKAVADVTEGDVIDAARDA